MLKIAGVDLVLDSTDRLAQKFIEKYISTSSYLPWLRPSNVGPKASGLTFAWPRGEPAFRLNRLHWPQGASRWAYGHYLAASDEVAAIMANAYGPDGGYNAVDLVVGTGDVGYQVGAPRSSDNTVTAEVYLLPPMPLSGMRGLNGRQQSLYVVSVVDIRWFWHQGSTEILAVDPATTWDDLYATIAGLLGISGGFSWDAIPSEYLKPSGMFNLSYQNIAFALDAVAFNVGHRIVAGFDGTFRAKNAAAERSRLDDDFSANPATRVVVAGGPSLTDSPGVLFSASMPPAYIDIGNIQIFFEQGSSCGTAGSYLSAYDNPDAPSAVLGMTFTDDAAPCFSGEGPPTNKAALDALTARFGADFLAWLRTQFDHVFAGIVAVEPNGFIDEMELDFDSLGTRTRIRSAPLNGWPRELGHQDSECPSSSESDTMMIGIVTTEITPAAGLTYGTGMAQFYVPGPSEAANPGPSIAVNNWFPAAIPAESKIVVATIGCQRFVVSAQC